MRIAALALVLLLQGCGAPSERGVDDVTPDEAAAVNDAAAMTGDNMMEIEKERRR